MVASLRFLTSAAEGLQLRERPGQKFTQSLGGWSTSLSPSSHRSAAASANCYSTLRVRCYLHPRLQCCLFLISSLESFASQR